MTMTTLTLIDLQTGLPHPAPDTGLGAHAQVGFELGWDYAHYRVTPPAPYALEASPLKHGLLAGQAAFGLRTLAATRHVRKWLQLRLNAWLRGRSVELVQVTPNYLQQIDVSHCPITRTALSNGTGAAGRPGAARGTAGSADLGALSKATLDAGGASIDRVRNDAGYAAGNLAVMSTKANHAKGAHDAAAAWRCVQQIEAEQLVGLGGLTADQWRRVATLCSFVEPMAHEAACALPLFVLPPNRLRLFNPVQALQAFVSQQLLKAGWSQRVSRFEALLPGKGLRHDFKRFFMALLPRVIEAGRSSAAQHARWAVEDAWRASLVQQHWARFARQLTPAQCEALLARAAARKLCSAVVVPLSESAAIDGWNLATRGYVPHAVPVRVTRQASVPVPVPVNLPIPKPMPMPPSSMRAPLQVSLPL